MAERRAAGQDRRVGRPGQRRVGDRRLETDAARGEPSMVGVDALACP